MKSLLVKYLADEITPSELEELREWLQKDKNKKIFKKYIQDAYLLNRSLDKIDVDTSFQKVWLCIQDQEKPVRKLFTRTINYAVAASVTLIFSFTAYLYYQSKISNEILPVNAIVENAIQAGTNKAVLTTEDGHMIVLEKGKTFKNKNVSSNGRELVYTSTDNTVHHNVYNYLTIPRGGEFFLKLADGTKVWLNSESKLKYPVIFDKNETRKVELVYGEAYFEVSPSTLHNGTKFNVLNTNQQIEVLGTEFNVKAYKDENKIYTTLVNGKISLKSGTTENILLPNRQAILDLNSNKIIVSQVDVYNDIAWKEGVFSFEGRTMKDIMNVLCRWYDIEVSYGNKELENARFNGALRKDQNIESVLETIKSFGVIKDYKIKNKKVELK